MRKVHSKRKKINVKTMRFAKKKKDPVVVFLVILTALLVLLLGSLTALILLNIVSIPDFL